MFTIKHVPNKRPHGFRVAVVVSKKVTKSAPKRNRIRRRIFEIIRKNGADYVKGSDVVIIVFNDKIALLPHAELNDAVLEVLSQIETSS